MNIIKAYRYKRPYTTAAATTKAAIHTFFFSASDKDNAI